MKKILQGVAFWWVFAPFVVFLLAYKRWACILALMACAGCVAMPKHCRPQGPTPQAATPQYVPTYPFTGDYLPEYPPPMGGPYFGMPPAVAPGLKVTPFIGPDGVAFCNEAAGVVVCQ